MIRAVLFDLDQTLVQFPPNDADELFSAGAERCYAYLSAHELPMPAFDPFVRQQRWIQRRIDFVNWITGAEPDGRQALRRLCHDYGLQRDEASLTKLGWLWFEPIAERAEVRAEVLPTIQLLTDHNIRLGIVANTTRMGAVHDLHLANVGLLDSFPARAYLTEIGSPKPQPQLFQAALDELGVPASQALFVGDDLKQDIIGAYRAGLQTAWLNPGDRRDVHAHHTIQRIERVIDILELPRTPIDRSSPIPPLHVEPALSR